MCLLLFALVLAPAVLGGGFRNGKRERVSSVGDKLEHAAKRAALGSLPDLIIAPNTLKRYRDAVS